MERIQLTGEAFNGKSMTDLYQHILDQAGIDWPEDMTFDCRKIEVSRDIQDRAYEAFARNVGAPEEQINMYWAFGGPKTDPVLPPGTVVLHDGYLYREEASAENQAAHTSEEESEAEL